jgi:excisionase family DNA binding protein
MIELLTTHEVADILRLHYTTVNRLCKAGKIEAIVLPHTDGGRQTYRIRRETLDKILGNQVS